MSDDNDPSAEPPPPEQPTLLGQLPPDELFARGMQSVKMTSGTHGTWQAPTVEEAARLFPGYEVVKLLGRGGMGAVYQARQVELDRLVAIKLLPLEISVDKDFADRFRREARAMAKLNHPNIISVYDFGTTREGHLFFVMEFVEGANLADIIHQVGLDGEQALSIVEQVCTALAYAHNKGIVHRDIKPANVMIDTESHVKVADFGLARLTDTSATDLGHTMTGTVMGTPDYMAPEQTRGMNVDHRADIYSLGVMLYEMLCKEVPKGIFDPPSHRTGCDARIDQIVIRAMQSAPDRRFQSTQEMRTAVTSARMPVDMPAPAAPPVASPPRIPPKPTPPGSPKKPPTPGAVNPALLARTETAVMQAIPPPVAKKRSPALLYGGITIVVVAVIAAAVLIGKQKKPGAAQVSTALATPAAPVTLEAWQDELTDSSLGLSGAVKRTPEGLLFSDTGVVGCYGQRGPQRDSAVRLRTTFGGLNPQLRARGSPAGEYHLAIKDTKTIWLGRTDNVAKRWTVLREFPLREPVVPGQDYELELRAEGQTFTAKFNGETLGTVTDGVFQEGTFGVTVVDHNGAPVLIKALEKLDLDATAGSSGPLGTATKDSPFVNSLGMKFVPVPILGGSTGGQRVLFSVWDTRVQDYEVFAKETKREWPEAGFEQGPTHPVANVTWEDAELFCQWLTERERKAGKLGTNEVYRLPSDHEWSCAVGIGDWEDPAKSPREKHGKIAREYPWGTQWPLPKGAGNYAGEELQPAVAAGKFSYIQGVIAGYNDGFVNTSPVGSFAANRFGLFDMGGNVWQWCEDWLDTERKDHVLRGAAWDRKDRLDMLSSHRGPGAPGQRRDDYGFRCVLAPASNVGAASLEPGAMKLWDGPGKIPAVPGVRWENDALLLGADGKRSSVFSHDMSRDGILRALVRMNPDAESPQINLRRRALNGDGRGSENNWEHYSLGWSVRSQSITLSYERGEKRTELKRWPLPRQYAADEWVRWELRAEGDDFAVSVDGQRLGTVHDASQPNPGFVMLFASAKGYFRDIEYVPLDGVATNVTGSQPAVIKLWDSPEKIPNDSRIRWENDAVVLDGGFLKFSGAISRDAILRSELRRTPDDREPQICLRHRPTTDGGADFYRLAVYFDSGVIRLASVHEHQGTTRNLRDWPLPHPYAPGEWMRLELRVVADELTVTVDGKVLGTVQDASQNEPGGVMLYAKANGYFRNIEYVPLDNPPSQTPVESTTPAAATKDAPFVNTLGMKFVPVPILGGPTDGKKVLFSVWDTRVQDYEVFVKETKREWPASGFEQGPDHPAVSVNWGDAQLFCQWLTERDRAVGRLPAGFAYRLPSDHEWSCAAEIGGREDAAKLPAEKSGAMIAFPWGTEWPPPKGSGNYAGEELQPTLAAGKYPKINEVIVGYNDGFVNTSPVGSYAANRFGLYDMGGNVWQWCDDWIDQRQTERVVRGGSWQNYDRTNLLLSHRNGNPPGARYMSNGFRCVLAPAVATTTVSPSSAGGWRDWVAEKRAGGRFNINHDFADDGTYVRFNRETMATWGEFPFRNGNVRTVCVIPASTQSAWAVQFFFRRGQDAQGVMRRYQANLVRDGVILQWCDDSSEIGRWHDIKRWPWPPGFDPAREFTMETRAFDDRLTVLLNNQELGTVQDATVSNAGTFGVGGPEGVLVRKLEFQSLDSPAAEPSAIKLWDAPDRIPKGAKIAWEEDALCLNHEAIDLSLAADSQVRNRVSRDAIIRAVIRMNSDARNIEVGLRHVFRSSPSGGVMTAYILGVKPDQNHAVLQTKLDGKLSNLKDWLLPRTYRSDEWLRVELRVVGDAITASIDDQVLGTIHDATVTDAGGVMLYAEGKGYFKDIVYSPLDRVPEESATTPAAATKDAPFINTLGMKFVPVPIQGGPTGGQQVLFTVWDTRVQDYAAYAGAKKVDTSWKTQHREGVPVGREPDHPVVGVNWEDAQAFCQWLTEKEIAEGKLPKGMKYRLPTDEEWSSAVGLPPEVGATPAEKNGKNSVDFPWGKDYPPRGKVGNYADETFHEKFPKPDAKDPKVTNQWIEGYTDGYATTSPVGSFPANAYGLYDMGGNVWQWCEDWFDASHKDRVLRGASWDFNDRYSLMSSNRHRNTPGYRYNNYGFRCVLAPDSATLPAATLEPGAIQLWDAPERLPKQQGVSWENGAMKLESTSIRYTANLSRDVIVRGEVRMNPDAHSRQICFRFSPAASAGGGFYGVAVDGTKKTVNLSSTRAAKRTDLRTWPLPRVYGPDEWLRLEVRAVGDEITVVADGQTLGTVRDTSQPEPGGLQLYASDAPGYFRNIVYVPLDKPGTGNASAATRAAALAANPANWVDRLNTLKWEGAWKLENGVLKRDGAAKSRELVTMQDGAIRVRARAAGSTETQLQLMLRSGPVAGLANTTGIYQFLTAPGATTCTLIYLERRNGENETRENLFSELVPAAVARQTEVEWELRAVGDELSAWANGQLIASAHHTRVPRGNATFLSGVGVEITKVETIEFPGELPHNAPTLDTPVAAATKNAPFENTLGMRFVPVPILGGPTGGKSVLFSVWDTRVQDYEVFAKETKREWPKVNYQQGPTHPAVNVSWEDAQAFCVWLTERERKAGKLGADEVYRLPSDHEWSCAVGIGDREDATKLPSEKHDKIDDVFPWGEQWPPVAGAGNYAGEELRPALLTGKYVHVKDVIPGYRDDFLETAPVGSAAANRFGLFDMGGNVWQWCGDWFDQSQKERVLRGASWDNCDRRALLSSNRGRHLSDYRYESNGFRCVLAPVAPGETAGSTGGVGAATSPQTWKPVEWSAESIAKQGSGVVQEGGWYHFTADKKSIGDASHLETINDRVIRCRIKVLPHGGNLKVNMSQPDQHGSYFFSLIAPDLARIQYIGPRGNFTLMERRLNPPIPAGSEVAMEFAIAGDLLMARVDGKIVGPVRDGLIPKRDRLTFQCDSSEGAWFKDAEYLDLTGVTDLEKALGWGPLGPATAAPPPPTVDKPDGATKEMPFVNSLGMRFVPVPVLGGPTGGQRVLFSVWDTRVQDYTTYAGAKKANDSWAHQNREGVPTGREPNEPVVGVSREDAHGFCQWLTEKEIAEGKLPKGLVYRLPTDEEWSWAAGLPPESGATPAEKKGKNTVDFPWGKDFPPKTKVGNYADENFHQRFPRKNGDQEDSMENRWLKGYDDGYAMSSPVGSFPPNAYGLYDMGGNVWQWCEDWFDASHKTGVLRGGSWYRGDRDVLLSSYRHDNRPEVQYYDNGFRCVLAPSSSAPSAGALEPGAIKLWDTPEHIAGRGRGWEDGALRLDNQSATMAEPKSRDLILRASIRANPEAKYPNLNVRVTPDSGYRLTVRAAEKKIDLAGVIATKSGPSIKSWPLPRAYGPEEWINVEFRAVDDTFTVAVDGQTLGSVQDSSIRVPGGVMLYDGGRAYFRDIVYVPLDKPGDAPLAQGSEPNPAIAAKDAPFENSLGMKFVPVPILSGPTDGKKVLFSVWDTRVQDYAAYAGTKKVDDSWTKAQKGGVPVGRELNHPVVAVSWEDAQAFCQWLTEKETAEGKLPKELKYRLPTDEEWSWAVDLPPEFGTTPAEKNVKTGVDFPWGKDYPPRQKVGNYADETFHAMFPFKEDGNNDEEKNRWIEGYADGFATTSPVGSFPANAYGLHDMGGNVWQWCEDWYDASHKERVLRGASWSDTDRGGLLSSLRHRRVPGLRDNHFGFRCVLAPSAHE